MTGHGSIASELLAIAPEVREALRHGRPVVALESTLITHGLPAPHNLQAARRAEQAVREAGAVPATVAVLGGRVRIGLAGDELALLAADRGARKLSRRDLALALALGQTGATTVATTMYCAASAGIEVFATGGIGGVHRGVEQTMDISADLGELARTPVTVVCAGAKVILDLPRTLEVLETAGVPVIGYRSDRFPAFFCTDSGLGVDQRIDDTADIARVIHTQRRLGLGGGVLVVQPPPPGLALPRAEVERWLGAALDAAAASGVAGKALTPFLLDHMAHLSEGRTLALNTALIEANASLAGHLAAALAARCR